MTVSNGKTLARVSAWANEKRGDWGGQQTGARDMDDFNNQCGFANGRTAQNYYQCQTRCWEDAVTGRLRTYQEATTDTYWADKIQR